MWKVDNFLLTDGEAYDRTPDDELNYDEIGNLPKYHVLDASFITKGDICVIAECSSFFLLLVTSARFLRKIIVIR